MYIIKEYHLNNYSQCCIYLNSICSFKIIDNQIRSYSRKIHKTHFSCHRIRLVFDVTREIYSWLCLWFGHFPFLPHVSKSTTLISTKGNFFLKVKTLHWMIPRMDFIHGVFIFYSWHFDRNGNTCTSFLHPHNKEISTLLCPFSSDLYKYCHVDHVS